MTEVSIAPCADYSKTEVQRALLEVLSPIGGLDWVSPGMKIVIKANLVIFFGPSRAATTHPALLCELTRQLCERGAHVTLGDSPGGLYTPAFVNRVYSATGVREIIKYGGKLNNNYCQTTAEFAAARAAKTFTYTSYLDEADAIINFCKLKSHGMMGMSGAVKNMFGAVPGTMKPEYHYRFSNHDTFAHMLVDLNEYFIPRLRLSICDAVVAMEGNGPTAGDPRKIGVLIASKSPYLLDLVAAELIGLTQANVPTLKAAYLRGFAPASAEQVNVLGNCKDFAVKDFKNTLAHTSVEFSDMLFGGRSGGVRGAFLRKLLRSRPEPQKSECTSCRVCMNICPVKVIEIKNKVAQINRKKCIYCFCCQEFCPSGAMKVKRTLVARFLAKAKSPQKKQ